MRKGVWIFIATLLLAGSAFAQTYVGDQACAGCHANMPEAGFFDGYMNSGHPWKIFNTAGMDPAPDTWPHTPVPPLPMAFGMQLNWSDVEYTIGNFYWKTRFIRRDGFIWTGDATDETQWNIATQDFVPYHAGEVDKPFNCGRCHTTGYDPTGNQDGLPGLIGTWTEDGIRCEACHGPSSSHAASPFGNPPPGGKACSECHYRDAQFRMPWSGGFGRHHQQSEDLSHSAHKNALTCESCHNPHRSVVYNDGGTKISCEDCHPGDAMNNFYEVTGMESVNCIDCHMPFMSKSAVAFNAHTGDIRGHFFQIMTDPVAAADNTYQDGGSTFWNQDANGDAFVTLDYACLGCHLDIGMPLTLEQASVVAQDIHKGPLAVAIAMFDVTATRDGVELYSEFASNLDIQRIIVYRDDNVIETVSGSTGNSFRYLDSGVQPGATYKYRIGVIDDDGEFMSQVREVTIPLSEIALGQNKPNPFNPTTTITYTLPMAQQVSLEIYDATGKLVRRLFNGTGSTGENSVDWNGLNDSGVRVVSGTYFYKITAGNFQATRKMVLLK